MKKSTENKPSSFKQKVNVEPGVSTINTENNPPSEEAGAESQKTIEIK